MCSSDLAVVAGGKNREQEIGVAWAELSTGRFYAAVFSSDRLADQLARINPSECLVCEDEDPLPPSCRETLMLTKRPVWSFAHEAACVALSKHFGSTSLEGLGFGDDDVTAIRAAGAVLEYLCETQRASLDHIERLVPYCRGGTLEIDESTRRSLEITRTIREGNRDGSLLSVIDRTVTAMGSRLLADWIANPLTDIKGINVRLDAVEEFNAQAALRDSVRTQLGSVYDLERLLARVTTGRATPRDLSFISRTLAGLPKLKAKLTARQAPRLQELEQQIDLCPELQSTLIEALVDDCPLSARDAGVIRTGYSEPLDELRELAAGGKQWIAEYQAKIAAEADLPNLKIGYNKVFGYYLELSNTHRDKAPDYFIRKQTLKNTERYITPELKEYEEKVISADDRARDLEYEIFIELRALVQASGSRLRCTAGALAQLDVLAALSERAQERGYCRPTMVNDPVLQIVDGRHPVLDIIEPQGTFVPNDTTTSPDEGMIMLITGPNMAGKSTYIRQVALLTLMAQAGSFVPAKSATIGIADRIFARVGASDELTREIGRAHV